jgi:hypothetical protein
MHLFLAALAVYKVSQFLDAVSPKEALPWVKIFVTTVLGYATLPFVTSDTPYLWGLAVATVAGTIHIALRLLTLLGDLALKRSLK